MATPSSQIYTYTAEDFLYGLAWSVREDKPCRFALGSFIERGQNYVDIVEYDGKSDTMVATPGMRIAQPFPATKVMFMPVRNTNKPDLIASSSDSLRLWKLQGGSVQFERMLCGSSGEIAPLTSFDWSTHDTSKLVTSSIDTSCCLWDIDQGQLERRVKAHDLEVFDVAWGAASVFATCSADGSARIVDTRDAQMSTIVYQTAGTEVPPLLRIGWNKQDPRYIATFASRSAAVLIVDVRRPGAALQLEQHTAPVNAFALAPHSPMHICTAGDDNRALIWNLTRPPTSKGLEPTLTYAAAAEVVSLQWSSLSPEHIAICFAKQAQILHV